ncbi:hypothetical protein D5086_033339 [Populus alba]|uniref:Uncharacterized protein n=1 Tax=Populus alba TaxID=43335 RepID=A0ACC4AHG5_POPAL
MLSQKQRRKLSDEDEKKHALPQEFIEQQRAYFAEIDAFELSEAEFLQEKRELLWDIYCRQPLLLSLKMDSFLHMNFDTGIASETRSTIGNASGHVVE